MREEELRAYRNKAIEKDRRAIENRLNHAFNQGYEMGRQMTRDLPVELQCVLCKIRSEIEQKIEQEEFARSVFRYEEKDTVKAEQCTGSIMAYNNVIKLIDKYMVEGSEE